MSAEALFRGHPDRPEGDLARMRAATVSQRPLAQAARTLNLGSYILLGKGESRTGGADKDSILSDTVEAIIGAVYVTHGLETAREFVHRLLGRPCVRPRQWVLVWIGKQRSRSCVPS